MQKNTSLLLLVALIILVGGGVFWYLNQTRPVPLTSTDDSQAATVLGTPAAQAINQQTGEVDQKPFEATQKVTTDTSLTSIEQELNQTVILEEDFSDL